MALIAGTISQVAVTAISDSLLVSAAVSGTTPYNYQWFRSTVSGFTPGSATSVSSPSTALGFNDSSLSPSTIYYYKVVVVDSNATPATVSTAQLAVTTLAPGSVLPITEVINVSVATVQSGIGAFNTSNLALFTRDAAAGSFGLLGYKIYLSPVQVATDFGTGSATYAMAVQVFSQQPNILLPGGYLVIIPFLSAETIVNAINRTQGLVSYFGIMQAEVSSQVDMLAAASAVQALNNLIFFVSYSSADVLPGGMLDLLESGGFTHSRGLYYGNSGLSGALGFMASYAGLGLSTVFSGSNTTQVMHLKSLTGVLPDGSMSVTLLNQCTAAGADAYVSIQGVAKVFTSGINQFFDYIYGLLAFVGGINVAGFNVLAQTNTKIPQTENGMDIIKGGYRQVCEQYVTNQYLAPGTWNSSTFFGNVNDLINNIANRGYYIFSSPISQQSAVDRTARKAPLVQIAIKLAGGVQSGTVIVNVNQ